VLDAATVGWSVAVGVVVTLLAAYLPARRAARTPPVAPCATTTSRSRSRCDAHRRRRRLAVLGTAAPRRGGLTDDGSDAASLVGLGSVALVLPAIALSPCWPGRSCGSSARSCRASGGRPATSRGRTPCATRAAPPRTASALMVGLALVSAFTIIGASTNASIDRLVGTALSADFVVSTAVGQPFTPEVADDLREIDGVTAVMQERFGAAQFDGTESFFAAVDPATLDRTLRLDYAAGGTDGLEGDGLLVDEPTAESRDLSVGDTVPTVLPTGDRVELTVGGVYATNQAVGPYVMSLETHAATGGTPLDRYVYVDVDDDADLGAVRSDLAAAVATYPVVDLKDQEEFAEEQRGQVAQLLLLINALLVLSVIIAVLGIVNTLALSVIERTREIGLLRAVGLSRSQLRRMVRLESVVISVYGAALGLVLGTVFGVSLARALAGQGIEVLVVPGARLAAFLLVGAVIGVLAAVWPARRAARLKVLDAIAAQ
jgi:putative ABC transport system permease protein